MSYPAHLAADHSAPPLSPAQLAHELNNLLDGSLRSVALVKHRLRDDAPDRDLQDFVEKYLGTADRSMRQMADVIERFANAPATPAAADPVPGPGDAGHDLDPPPAPGPAPGPAPAGFVLNAGGDLRDAYHHAVNVYGPTIQQHGIAFAHHLDPAVQDLPGGAVYTVLANALNNAVQAIQRSTRPAPHRIHLGIRGGAAEIVVCVTDTGDGIDPTLFDSRGRFRFGLTTRPRGHGVGLGVCRQIAEDLGGQLTVANADNAYGGAQLTLRFPRPAAPPQPARVSPLPEARRAG
jgi:signal transduction histidine kinase